MFSQVSPNIVFHPLRVKVTIKVNGNDPNTDQDNQLIPQDSLFGQRRAHVFSIHRPISSHREAFLQNDMFIEFNMLDEDSAFLAFKQLWKNFRPVQCVRKLKQSTFLAIDFDQTHRGLRNFERITRELDSMQDAGLHLLANRMRDFEQIMHVFSNAQSRRRALSAKNMDIFKHFKDVEIPAILSKVNSHDLYQFAVYQCVDDILDLTWVQNGWNENLIRMLGSDSNSYAQLIMRQGWFDLMQFKGRNGCTIDYINIISSMLRSNFDISQLLVSCKMEFITIDGIKGTCTLVPEIFYCFGEEADENFPHMKMLIGYMVLYKISLDEQTKQHIIAVREQNKGVIPSDLIYESTSNSMQDFFYQFESEVFREFAARHEDANSFEIQQSLHLKQLRTCKIRTIHNNNQVPQIISQSI